MLLAILVPPLVALALARRPVTDRWLARLTARTGVAVDDRTRPVAATATGRRWRAVGGSLGWLAAVGIVPLIERLGDAAVPRSTLVLAALASGWLLGNLLAELAQWRRPSGPTAASLRLRRVHDYAPTWPRRVSQGAVLLTLAVLPIGVLVVSADVVDEWIPIAVTAAGVATASGIVASIGLRAVVDRPQDASGGPELVRVDDALRAVAAHRITGTALALTTWCAVLSGTQVVFELVPGLVTPFVVAGLLLLGCGWGVSHNVGIDLPTAGSVRGRRTGSPDER